jgi:glycosyltransferase involved in cell wall biosynthesis
MRMTVHFVYVKGNSISTPAAITNEVASRLQGSVDLKVYDWEESNAIIPRPGDILIGHPNRDHPSTVFNKSFYQHGWGRRIIFSPFAHGMMEFNGYTDSFVAAADVYLAICGRYWYDTAEASLASHWLYKMVHCDLAVNRRHFPIIKTCFNEPGRRKFLYIGHTAPSKGTDFLCRLADANHEIDFGWAGEGRMESHNIKALGRQDFSKPEAQQIVSQYDFLIACGRSDANPTTILEGSAWGLVPVATLQSGYYEDEWLINIPLDDVRGASEVLQKLNACPESTLLARQQAGFKKLDDHYNWDRVALQVKESLQMEIPIAPVSHEWQIRRKANRSAIRAAINREKRRQRKAYYIDYGNRAVHKLLRYLKW